MKPANQFISLWDYFSTCFVPLNNLELPLKPLHRGMCDKLQQALLGELGKSYLVLNVPPRVGKTKCCESAITWLKGYFPDAQTIYTSYSNELATTSVRYIQNTIGTDWYGKLFPATRLGAIRQSDHFTTTAGGKVYGDGVGGTLLGLGAGLKRRAGGCIVIDDPSKPDEALSRVVSAQLIEWFENTLKSRRNSSQWTPIIVCMQRLAPDDLSGYLLENYPDDVELVKFPGLVDGESVIPETLDTRSMLQQQALNPFGFSAMIQQEPVVRGGNLIKTEDFRYYDPNSPPKFEIKIMTCDTAMKSQNSNDWSVIQVWGRSLHRAFMIDQARGKWEPAQLLSTAKTMYSKHNKPGSPVAYMAIEEAGAGMALIHELRKRGIPSKGLVPLKDKVSRVEEILAFVQTGMTYLPKGAPWLATFELETAQFRKDGKAKHDDQVDTFVYAVKLLLGKGTSILNVLGKPKRAA